MRIQDTKADDEIDWSEICNKKAVAAPLSNDNNRVDINKNDNFSLATVG